MMEAKTIPLELNKFRKKLRKINQNSWGIAVPKNIVEQLDLDEVHEFAILGVVKKESSTGNEGKKDSSQA